jgi:hypothetical protein
MIHMPPAVSDRELNAAMIGREVNRDHFIDGQISARLLMEQSETMADRLERCDMQGRSSRGEVTVVGMVSGQAESSTDFRNTNLIPVQQSRNVRDILKSISYMMDTAYRKNQFRMLVVPAGWCRVGEYREHHEAHTRRMSKFAALSELRELGITMFFYNMENTIHRPGVAMLNLHSHALIRCNRRLGRKKWIEFLDLAKRHFPKGYVHDSKIGKAAECVKYSFKPSEFDKMTDAEFGEFALQVMGGRCQVDAETGEIKTRLSDGGELIEVREGPLKFFHPLGPLREFRSELKRNRQKLVRVSSDDGWTWNTTERKKPEPKPEGGGATKNIVLAVTRPMPKFTPRMEPCIIVQDYSGDFDQLVREAGLESLVSEVREIFDARVRADAKALREAENDSQAEGDSIRDTTTTTVRERGGAIGIAGLTEPPPREYSQPEITIWN